METARNSPEPSFHESKLWSTPIRDLGLKIEGTPLESAVADIRRELEAAATRDPAAVVGVLSPFLTCEEALLLAKYLKGLSADLKLALGPVPVVGVDDTYPKNARGDPVQPVKFTIRAEKCPNRRGVEEVLRHFQGDVIGFPTIVEAAGRGEIRALYLTAGYSPRAQPWLSAEQAAVRALS